MRLLLHTSRMGVGGAQRVLALLATAWSERGWAIALATFDAPGAASHFPLPTEVAFRPLGASSGRISRSWGRVRRLRAEIRAFGPDAIVSFQPTANLHALLAARGLGVPVIVSERNDPAHFDLGVWKNSLRRALYPWASRIVAQTERATATFPAAWRRRTVIIPNPAPGPIGDAASLTLPRPLLVAVGRLAPQKGFDLLLEAFAASTGRFPEWSLAIVGEGSERGRLEAMRARLNLTGRVFLPGAVPDAAPYLAGADAFVLSSRYEGFPNALLEAMAAGLPVLATDCPSGPREIIRSGIDGLLVPPGDVAALAGGLAEMLGNAELRHRLAQRAPEVLERFSLQRVLEMWDQVLEQVYCQVRGA